MARYVDAEKVLEHKFNGFEFEKYSKIISDGKSKTDDNIYAFKVGWNEALQAVHDVEPTADVQEVVRCKDCKHQEVYCYETRGKKYFSYNCELAENNSHVCLDDDFCSRGERREK